MSSVPDRHDLSVLTERDPDCLRGFVSLVLGETELRRVLVRYEPERDLLVTATDGGTPSQVSREDLRPVEQAIHEMAISFGARFPTEDEPARESASPSANHGVSDFPSTWLFLVAHPMQRTTEQGVESLVVVGGDYDRRPFAPFVVYLGASNLCRIEFTGKWAHNLPNEPQRPALTDSSWSPELRKLIVLESTLCAALIGRGIRFPHKSDGPESVAGGGSPSVDLDDETSGGGP